MKRKATKTATKAANNRSKSTTAKAVPTANPQPKQNDQEQPTPSADVPELFAQEQPTPSAPMTYTNTAKVDKMAKEFDACLEYLNTLLPEFRKVCPNISPSQILNLDGYRPRGFDLKTDLKRTIFLTNLGNEQPTLGGLPISVDRALDLVEIPGLDELLALVSRTRNTAEMSFVIAPWIECAPDGVLTYDRAKIVARYTTTLTPSQVEKYNFFQAVADNLNEYLKRGGTLSLKEEDFAALCKIGLSVAIKPDTLKPVESGLIPQYLAVSAQPSIPDIIARY